MENEDFLTEQLRYTLYENPPTVKNVKELPAYLADMFYDPKNGYAHKLAILNILNNLGYDWYEMEKEYEMRNKGMC